MWQAGGSCDGSAAAYKDKLILGQKSNSMKIDVCCGFGFTNPFEWYEPLYSVMKKWNKLSKKKERKVHQKLLFFFLHINKSGDQIRTINFWRHDVVFVSNSCDASFFFHDQFVSSASWENGRSVFILFGRSEREPWIKKMAVFFFFVVFFLFFCLASSFDTNYTNKVQFTNSLWFTLAVLFLDSWFKQPVEVCDSFFCQRTESNVCRLEISALCRPQRRINDSSWWFFRSPGTRG